MTGMLLMHALATLAFASDLSVETVSRLKVAWTYVWNGKRYVVVCAGGHGKVDGSRLGGAVIAVAVE